MRLQRKLTNKEWKEIGEKYKDGGVHMYRGKKTYFYNGENLLDDENSEWLIHDEQERDSWEVVIILPGVEIIPERTFNGCKNVKAVIMSDTVKRIEWAAFFHCSSLEFIKLSRNLEYIGRAFYKCESLTSIFIPPSCRVIDGWAFDGCTKLIILSVPQTTQLGRHVINKTALFDASPFESKYYRDNILEVNAWVKNINYPRGIMHQKLALHRACSSFQPLTDIVYGIVREQGIKAMNTPNKIGITPSEYLYANPYADIDEKKILKRYILDMMGELV